MKEAKQITIRVDTKLLNATHALTKDGNTHLIDIVERGLALALAERNHQLSQWEKEVRFMVANTTKKEQALVRGLLVAMARPLVALEKGKSYTTPEYEKLFELVCWFLERHNQSPYADAALEFYLRRHRARVTSQARELEESEE